MHKSLFRIVLPAVVFVLIAHGHVGAAEKELHLVSQSGASSIQVKQGQEFTVVVETVNSAEIAGASFSVIYDSSVFGLQGLTSTFFNTFTAQGIPTPDDQGFVTVDGEDYYSPLVYQEVSGGASLAGARLDNGSAPDVELFSVTLRANAGVGTYTMGVAPTMLNNTAAGYPEEGEEIDMLVGIGATPTTYISHSVPPENRFSCTIHIVDMIDTDSDGIDDDWERAHVPPGTPQGSELDVFTATGDYDNDGYSDLQEYLNRGENDPAGNAYDPTVRNAPGGTGYVPVESTILMFIPVIIQGANQ
jgi:hypothetical protein